MPIYEYECRACRHRFEALVRLPAADAVECPACHGTDLEKLISMFAPSSDGTRKMALTSAQRANAKVTRDKAWADYEYDKTHRHD